MPDAQLTLAAILTAGGVTATAAIVTGLIAMLKRLPGLGSWVDADHEPPVAYVISAILVAAAFVNQDPSAQTPVGGFGAFLAWYGVANLSGNIHNTIRDLAKPEG